MRLLLVEDDNMIGEAVLDVLRAEHFAVDWVRDGEMADTALHSETYDLVLLDLGLPRLDGIEVLRRLRARCRAGRSRHTELADGAARFFPHHGPERPGRRQHQRQRHDQDLG